MNSSFYKLDKNKQQNIINASISVFANNSYKHALTDDIANRAGIAKGSLFNYFNNKQYLYLHMYRYCLKTFNADIKKMFSFNNPDFFDLVKQGMFITVKLYKKYPNLYKFIKRANEEQNPKLATEISMINITNANNYVDNIYKNADYSKFKPKTDIGLLFRMMDWCGKGITESNYYKDYTLDEIYAESTKILNYLKQATYQL